MPVFSKISSKTASAASHLSAAVATAKAKAGPHLPRGATVVNGVKLSVTVATKLGLSVPYMQGISEAANEIMKYTAAMKTNREQSKRLATVSEELMNALLVATVDVEEGDLNDDTRMSLAELEWKLQGISKAMGEMLQETFVRRLLSKDKHASQIVQHKEDLQSALEKFKASDAVSTYRTEDNKLDG